jgi:hypothetical protein
MTEWGNPWNLAGVFLLFVAWLLYEAVRPVKDFYVLERLYFVRLYEEPWRGEQASDYYHGFDDYLAAKVLFDQHEVEYIGFLDDGLREAEHSVFMVPARTKLAAITTLKSGKAYQKELLHRTPFGKILQRRAEWKTIFDQQNQS